MEARAHWLGGIASLFLLACGGEETSSSAADNGNGNGGDGTGAGAAGGNENSGGAGTGAQGGSASGGSGGDTLGAYPGGPYGAQEGDTIENLLWEGYVNEEAQALANTQPFVDYSMDAVRQSGKALAFVHFGAVFWSGCNAAAQVMGVEGTSVVEAGGVFVEVVEQGSSPGPSDQADLDGWIQTHDLEITTVKPKDGDTSQLEGREWSYIIDLETMTIVYKKKGSFSEALDEMMLRLENP